MTSTTAPTRRFSKGRMLAGLAGLAGIAGIAGAALLLVGTADAGPTVPPPDSPPVGGPAPAFTAVDTRGKSHSLAAYAGKWVVLEWFNHECPYTKKH